MVPMWICKMTKGLTAYGKYIQWCILYDEMRSAMTQQPCCAESPANYVPPKESGQSVLGTLLPSNGPSEADKRGGAREGIIVYDDNNNDVKGQGKAKKRKIT